MWLRLIIVVVTLGRVFLWSNNIFKVGQKNRKIEAANTAFLVKFVIMFLVFRVAAKMIVMMLKLNNRWQQKSQQYQQRRNFSERLFHHNSSTNY